MFIYLDKTKSINPTFHRQEPRMASERHSASTWKSMNYKEFAKMQIHLHDLSWSDRKMHIINLYAKSSLHIKVCDCNISHIPTKHTQKIIPKPQAAFMYSHSSFVHHYLTTSSVWAWVCQATRSAYLQRLYTARTFLCDASGSESIWGPQRPTALVDSFLFSFENKSW